MISIKALNNGLWATTTRLGHTSDNRAFVQKISSLQERFQIQSLMIHKLRFNQNYCMFTSILLIKIGSV